MALALYPDSMSVLTTPQLRACPDGTSLVVYHAANYVSLTPCTWVEQEPFPFVTASSFNAYCSAVAMFVALSAAFSFMASSSAGVRFAISARCTLLSRFLLAYASFSLVSRFEICAWYFLLTAFLFSFATASFLSHARLHSSSLLFLAVSLRASSAWITFCFKSATYSVTENLKLAQMRCYCRRWRRPCGCGWLAQHHMHKHPQKHFRY